MTAPSAHLLNEFHWLMDVVHNMDVGLVVLDLQMRIQVWNSFMQNHSARGPSEVLERNLFEVFPELPENWFRRKLQTVIALHNTAFTTWEQRPYLFYFKNYRPVTGMAEHMYQNCTILPLKDSRGEITHLCLMIYDVTEVAINRLQLQKANAQLEAISRTDGLTGLLNRKAWEQTLQHEFKRFQRYQHVCSLIMFDIDHFKRINDSYGHPTGDQVIRQTAATLTQSVRDIDVAGRYGGEEFAIILVDTDVRGAQLVAERLRSRIAESVVTYESHHLKYTISLGIAEVSTDIATPTEWIECADRGLYQAKHAGRNCTRVYRK